MLRFVKLAPVVLVFLFVACSDSTGPVSLGLNRLRWEKQNLHDYEYTARRVCFCPESGHEVFVTVLSDTIFSVRLVATGVEASTVGWYTVTDLFDLVERSLDQTYTSVDVEYDPDLGYPTQIDLGCTDGALDCGLTIEAKNLYRIGFILH